MNIGIDARMYGPKQTGIGNYIKYLIEELARLDKKNSYYIFLRKEEYAKFSILHSKFFKILADYPWYSLQEQTLFLRKLLDYPLDLAHFPHFNIPLFYRKPFIVSIHDLTPKFFPGETGWPRQKIYDIVLRKAVRRSLAIITPSQFTKDDILKHYSVPSSKIHVVYEGITLPHTVYGSKSLSPPKPYILYVGVWRYHKNIKGLLEAFMLLKKEALPHHLFLAGDPGKYYQGIKEYIDAQGLSREVRSLGFLGDQELFFYYKHAALVVLPSFYEGFGLVPLEALSVGTPVACSRIPPLKEILGDSAFFFDPKNVQDMALTIKKALFDERARVKKRKKAKRLLQRYNWEENATKTLELYLRSGNEKIVN